MRPQNQLEASNRPDAVHFVTNDRMLTATLKNKAPYAAEEFYKKYGRYIQRVLMRVMGVEKNFNDILQEVYVEIFANIHSIKDGNRLKAWITSITIFTARQNIKRIVRRRATLMDDDEKITEMPSICVHPETQDAVHITQLILEELPVDERIVFFHRFIEGMNLDETAAACGVSRSTVNRRLSRARQNFNALIHRNPLLEKWIKEGRRWESRQDIHL